jgi:DNA-binding XRE family transcriptional regulator
VQGCTPDGLESFGKVPYKLGMIDMAKHSLHEHFCEAVKRRRLELGLTQADVAMRLGVNRATVAETEAGRYEPTLSKLAAYATALETTVGELLGEVSSSVE